MVCYAPLFDLVTSENVDIGWLQDMYEKCKMRLWNWWLCWMTLEHVPGGMNFDPVNYVKET